jgi:hypothetical protein
MSNGEMCEPSALLGASEFVSCDLSPINNINKVKTLLQEF